MDPAFDAIFTRPDNEIFRVVFFPDRIFHATYLNATRSPRYRYNVLEVRNKLDIAAIKGEVYLDGSFLCNFLRIEYRASRLVEMARERGRLLGNRLHGWVRLLPLDESKVAEAEFELEYCRWTDAYQVEFWETLEPPTNHRHDFSILTQMGRNGAITRVKAFAPALRDIKTLMRLDAAFREAVQEVPMPMSIANAEWDNSFLRSHQEPRTQEPSSQQNTVPDLNYRLDFQRGWFLDTSAIAPVRYRNAMMDGENKDSNPDNVLEMRWILQRELGGSMVFFHEVLIPPGKVEGTHQHVGSEECYYIVSGEGIAYMAVGDDPATEKYPTVTRQIYGGLPPHECKELPIHPGNVIYTKSGGIHGIRNTGAEPLKFVAFLYHTV